MEHFPTQTLFQAVDRLPDQLTKVCWTHDVVKVEKIWCQSWGGHRHSMVASRPPAPQPGSHHLLLSPHLLGWASKSARGSRLPCLWQEEAELVGLQWEARDGRWEGSAIPVMPQGSSDSGPKSPQSPILVLLRVLYCFSFPYSLCYL